MWVLGLILAIFSVSADPCVEALTPMPAEPLKSGYVLLGRPQNSTTYVQRQILQALNLTPGAIPVQTNMLHSTWIRDWFPQIIKSPKTGKLEAIFFTPTARAASSFLRRTNHGEEPDHSLKVELMMNQISYRDIPVYLDWGNVVMDEGNRVFIADVVFKDNKADTEEKRENLIQKISDGLGREVIILPSLPREATGHVDVFLLYAGKNRFVIADSRDNERKKALDQTSNIISSLGYQVTRVMSAGPDTETLDTRGYINALIVNDKVLLPVYSSTELAWLNFTQEVRWKIYNFLGHLGKKFQDKMPIQEKIRRSIRQIEEDDMNAIKAYEALGYYVYPIYINMSMTNMHGAVHCLTRCLPPELTDLFPAKKILK